MAEMVTGDTTKGIKRVGDLSLRISKFDSYRLFTLYEKYTDDEKKLMNISGNQRYYLVFKSPKKEIRIPEFETNGSFEVDKSNGCVLFKITKKQAEDILSMKTSGERIFHIVRVFEDRDENGKVLAVTDEVEVYNGKWGDDSAFSSYNTDRQIETLNNILADITYKYDKLFQDYNDLNKMYNDEIERRSSLEKDLEAISVERDSLQAMLDEYTGNTYDGTLLSTDTKYIAFEETLDNISFTEDQYNQAMNDLMTKGEIDLTEYDLDDPRIELEVKIYEDIKDLKINIYQNDISVGSAVYNQGFYKTVYINHEDVFRFECVGSYMDVNKYLTLSYDAISGDKYGNSVIIETPTIKISSSDKTVIEGRINFMKDSGDSENTKEDINAVGNIGKLICYIN